MADRNKPYYGVGGTRVDEMLPPDVLADLIEQVTPAPRASRRRRLLSQISTEAIKFELEKREEIENAGE